jgi:DNA polymerase III subunit epsilon
VEEEAMNFDKRALIAIDVETSGTDPYAHQLLAASLVPIGSDAPPFSFFVRPAVVTWSPAGRQYFGLYESAWNELAKRPDEAMRDLGAYLQDSFSSAELFLVGHNVGFDISFLKQISRGQPFPRLSHRAIDTHTILRLLSWMGRIPESACSSSGAFSYFGIEPPAGDRHTALGDACATRDLFLRLAEMLPDGRGDMSTAQPCVR